jgi:hypothetical protein
MGMTTLDQKEEKKFNWSIVGLIIILAVFLFYSVYLAMNLKTGIIPDEPYRYEVSRYFSQTWGIPKDVPLAIEYGDNLSRTPFLGYWIFGRIINVISWVAPESTDFQQLVWVRIVNGLFALGTLIFTYLLSRELIKNNWLQILPVFFLANTMMFVFLAGGVNYDNPTNLFCVMGIYFLVRVLNDKHFLSNSCGWLISFMIASLIKYAILPLILFTAVIWVIYVIKHKGILGSLKPARWQHYLLIAVVAILFVGNLMLYGRNLLEFQSLTPNCDDTYSQEVCQESVFFLRYKELGLPEKLSILGAFKQGYPEPVRYLFEVWIPEMLARIFGIMGHLTYYPIVISYFQIAFYWLIFLGFRYIKKPGFHSITLAVLLVAYAAVLFVMNYDNELVYGFKQVAFQGRYFFPVISLAFVMATKLLVHVDNKYLRYGTIIALVLLFLYGGPFRFFWYGDSVFLDWFI